MAYTTDNYYQRQVEALQRHVNAQQPLIAQLGTPSGYTTTSSTTLDNNQLSYWSDAVGAYTWDNLKVERWWNKKRQNTKSKKELAQEKQKAFIRRLLDNKKRLNCYDILKNNTLTNLSLQNAIRDRAEYDIDWATTPSVTTSSTQVGVNTSYTRTNGWSAGNESNPYN